MEITELKALKTQLNKTREKRQEKKQKLFFKILGTSALDNKVKTLEQQLYKEAMKYLEQNNEQYAKLAAENYDLLRNDKVIYKVKTSIYSVVGTRSSAFLGAIHHNGYAYLETTHTNFGAYPLSRYEYPKKLMGHIDYFGHVNLSVKQIGGALLNTLPRKFEGYVGKNGLLVLETTKRDLDFFNGKMAISQLIGVHFRDRKQSEQFFANAAQLKKILDEFIEQL